PWRDRRGIQVPTRRRPRVTVRLGQQLARLEVPEPDRVFVDEFVQNPEALGNAPFRGGSGWHQAEFVNGIDRSVMDGKGHAQRSVQEPVSKDVGRWTRHEVVERGPPSDVLCDLNQGLAQVQAPEK